MSSRIAGVSSRIAGVPIAWIAIFGAIIGITSLIPIMPYPGGGGYVPLSIPIMLLAPMIFGVRAGIASAFIGGLIGMFVSPIAFPLGFFDVFFTGMLPAIFVGLAINGNNTKYWIFFTIIFILNAIAMETIPYYYPGVTAGFPIPPQPTYILTSSIFWLPWIPIYLSPLGSKYIPKWIRNKNRKYRYFSIFLGALIGIMCWLLPWQYLFFLWLKVPPELAIAGFLVWAWLFPLVALITTIIAMPVVEGLEKSGFQPAKDAIWTPR